MRRAEIELKRRDAAEGVSAHFHCISGFQRLLKSVTSLKTPPVKRPA